MCGIWSEHWQADPPPLQHLQQCWQHSYVYFSNTTSGYDMNMNGYEARALNFFGRPWWGLFWVEPVLLNRCIILATMLQLSFWVLAIFLWPTPSLCKATIFCSDPQRVLCHEVPCWTSSDQYERVRVITPNLTHTPHSHLRPCNTNESHDSGERKWLIVPNLEIFT